MINVEAKHYEQALIEVADKHALFSVTNYVCHFIYERAQTLADRERSTKYRELASLSEQQP